jgi:hypothetical protein
MIRSMHRILFAGVVLASLFTASSSTARAQDSSAKTVADSISVSVADIEKAAEQLAIAVESAVRKAAEDPAVKLAALKVAKNAVSAAQIAVTSQANVIQAALDALAREIATVTEKQHTKGKTH